MRLRRQARCSQSPEGFRLVFPHLSQSHPAPSFPSHRPALQSSRFSQNLRLERCASPSPSGQRWLHPKPLTASRQVVAERLQVLPLHLPFPLPRMLFPLIFAWLPLSQSLSSQLKGHLSSSTSPPPPEVSNPCLLYFPSAPVPANAISSASYHLTLLLDGQRREGRTRLLPHIHVALSPGTSLPPYIFVEGMNEGL